MIEGIDTAAMTAWLTKRVDVVPPLAYERVGLGQSNLTYLVTDAKGSRLVLRRPPMGELLASAHDVAREHRILSALQDGDVPLPVVHGLCEDPAVADAPVLVVSFVDGLVLEERSDAEGLAPAARHAVGLSVVDTLARIHATDLQRVGLADLASHKPYAARQLRRWTGQWELSRTRDLPDLDRLTVRLHDHEPAPGEVTLVHGDSHLRNVIVDPVEARVRAILDWELATLGDPLADLGTLLAYWPQAGDPPTMRFDASTVEGLASRSELVEHYAQVSGRDVASVPFWHGLGLWKLAIILEGVRRRQQDDPRNLTAAGVIPAEAVDQLVAHAHVALSEDL
ncbi:phosphotransferase family protein [Nocardioides carbamazepini]|uniref:phosphotransferase family protein n=1 Tax=Nocardioides carbamazepini TaxID=2854259 RepID=UPI00214A1DA0|nr:phosphotransferase family protein [Nocardioides carbamazepini]MCR1783226.1 phosphotransferase family protein [Nocardioides carbamazepini]